MGKSTKLHDGVVGRRQVSTTVMDLVVVFALFVFMLALLCFSVVATVFSVNKDLYNTVY